MESQSLSSPVFIIAHNFCHSFRAPMVSLQALRPTDVSLTQLSCQSLNAKRRAFPISCESTSTNVSSSNGYPKYDRLLPCPNYKLPPRVEHLVVAKEERILDYISKALDLPPLFVADLIQFGAVHYALVHPEPPLNATLEQIKVFKEATTTLALRRRASIKGKTIQEAQKTYRITDENQIVEAGTFLRVHVHPKRYPMCYKIDWKSRIIAVTKSFVVVDKPAATSVGGNIDNLEENCATFAARALGLTTPLRITHQIDNCTEGCVVLARTKKFSSIFNEKIRAKAVKKLYLALAAAPLPIGTVTHYMRPSNKAPRLISEDFIDGWHICQLEITECVKIPWPSSFLEKKHCGDQNSQWPSKRYAYECRINLLTGRTHQIRAQLAAFGAPIVGDSAYMPAALAEKISPGTNPFGKNRKKPIDSNETKEEEEEEEEEEPSVVEEWILKHGKEPSLSIGLQACKISWDGGEYVFEAGAPWWRRRRNSD